MGFVSINICAVSIGRLFALSDSESQCFSPNRPFDRSRRRFFVDLFRKGGGPVNSFVRLGNKGN
jgi:hypothetical protein